MNDFLDSEDRRILVQTLTEYHQMEPAEWWRFWSWDELQLGGNFNLRQLQAFVKAMERMAKRHAAMHDNHIQEEDNAPQQAEG